MRKTPLMRAKEAEYGQSLEQLIREMTARGMGREEIAQHLGVSYWTLTDWLRADRLGATFHTTVRFAGEEAPTVQTSEGGNGYSTTRPR